jgi:hypothetical protein
MITAERQPATPQAGLRWFQYSLRSLFLFTLVVAVTLGLIMNRVNQSRQQQVALAHIFAAFEKAPRIDPDRAGGALVRYAYQLDRSGQFDASAELPWPKWLVQWAGVDFFSDVTELQVSYCQMRDYDLQELEPYLMSLHALRKLHLGPSTGPSDSVDISDDGLDHLAGLNRLDELTLEGPQFTDASVTRLAKMANLKSVTLIGTGVTEQGIERLEVALPACLVCREEERSWYATRWRARFGSRRAITTGGSQPDDWGWSPSETKRHTDANKE